MTIKTISVALSVLVVGSVVAGAQSRTVGNAKAAPRTAPASAAPANLHLVVAPVGNEARYRVREQLVGINFPTDAIGKTPQVTGMLVVSPSGEIVSDSSRIVVNVQSLKSDKTGRDKTIRETALESNKYPTVEFVPTSFVGLSAEPGETAAAFSLVGNMTVHGTTRPVTWNVSAHVEGSDVVGSATTKFSFEYFGITPPKKSVLAIPISVADTIKLEYDFRFAPATY